MLALAVQWCNDAFWGHAYHSKLMIQLIASSAHELMISKVSHAEAVLWILCLRTNIVSCTLAGYETLSTTWFLLLEVGQGSGLGGN